MVELYNLVAWWVYEARLRYNLAWLVYEARPLRTFFRNRQWPIPVRDVPSGNTIFWPRAAAGEFGTKFLWRTRMTFRPPRDNDS